MLFWEFCFSVGSWVISWNSYMFHCIHLAEIFKFPRLSTIIWYYSVQYSISWSVLYFACRLSIFKLLNLRSFPETPYHFYWFCIIQMQSWPWFICFRPRFNIYERVFCYQRTVRFVVFLVLFLARIVFVICIVFEPFCGHVLVWGISS